jgi:hypothetical protein
MPNNASYYLLSTILAGGETFYLFCGWLLVAGGWSLKKQKEATKIKDATTTLFLLLFFFTTY